MSQFESSGAVSMKVLRAIAATRLNAHSSKTTGTGYRYWSPLPGQQTIAYHSPADILFYGGAAGGGKTDLLVGVAAASTVVQSFIGAFTRPLCARSSIAALRFTDRSRARP